jgi:uncharacterized pyridoxamine 5'-phosphate oxidase family protein
MKKVFDLLKGNDVTTLATCTNNKPRASAVNYYMVGDAIVFATSPSSIKAHNLEQNNRISISVKSMPKFVTLDGIVATPTPAEIDGYNKKLFEVHPEFKEIVEKGLMEPFVYYKVVVETAYYSDYTNGILPAEIIKA